MGRRRRIVVAMVVVAVAVSACSGGAEPVADTTDIYGNPITAPPATVATTASSSTTVATGSASSTTAPATSTSTSTSTSTTTTTTTTTTPVAPSTTIPIDGDPLTDTAAATLTIMDTVRQARAAYNATLLDPSNVAASEGLAQWYTAEAVAAIRGQLDGMRDAGVREVTHERLPSSITPDLASLILNVANGSAEIEACFVNTNATVQDQSDGTAKVLDDRLGSSRLAYTLEVVEGRWRVASFERTMLYEGDPSACVVS